MDIERIKKRQYAAYEKFINIDLFNKIITFITNTSIKADAWATFREIEEKCIWLTKTNDSAIQDEYKFQYFGELLERYEERIGNNIKDIRAIALAVGYGSKLIENNMIIGTQLVNFISKIKNIAQNDIYLKGALYLYDSQKYNTISEEFMNKNYTNTEELIFVLSIFYERMDDFFRKNKKQIIDLLGNSRNILVIGNVGIYAWLIKNLYKLICKDRKKDIALLRALTKIPTGLQIEEIETSKNENTTVCKELTNNGYSKEEIIYLNYLLLYYDTVPKRIIIGCSVIEEKIATNLCKILINSEKTYTEDVYDLIVDILYKYEKFYIKCYGYYKIKDVLDKELDIINPITFSEMYYALDTNLYSFNILDKKWDIVATKTEGVKYQEIFDKFLLNSKYDRKKLEESISKYNELTGKKYIESFLDYNSDRNLIFALLVNNNVIILKDILEYIIKNNIQKQDSHLKKYIDGINNRKSFELLKYLLRLNKYSIKEINALGFNFSSMARTYIYSNDKKIYDLNIERKFLNIKEHKILFNCLEKYIFYNKPYLYFGFLEEILKNDLICKLFRKEDLREMYLSLCEADSETYNKKWLQEKYLTAKEFNEICEHEKKEEELKKQKELLEIKQLVTKKFEEITEKNSFENLYNFCHEYEYNSRKLPLCVKIVKDYMIGNISTFSKESKEIRYFIEILELFIEKELLTPIEFTKLTYEYAKEEVKENECIITTY